MSDRRDDGVPDDAPHEELRSAEHAGGNETIHSTGGGAPAASCSYLYDHVTAKIIWDDLDFSRDATQPGQLMPMFDLPTADGARLSTADLLGKPFLLFAGSISCPMAASANIFLKRLHAKLESEIAFVMLYVREAHPGENWPQPRTLQEKTEHAQALKARDELPWPIAIDDVEGTVHRALDARPNVAYLADHKGEILFRSLCAGDEKGVREAMESVARGERPPVNESRRRFTPMAQGIGNLRWITCEAGPRAERDLWRALPPVALIAWVADFYRPLSPKWRAIASAMTVFGAAGAAGAFLARQSQRSRSRVAGS